MTQSQNRTRFIALFLGVVLFVLVGAIVIGDSDAQAGLEPRGSSPVAAGPSRTQDLGDLERGGGAPDRVASALGPRLFVVNGDTRASITPTRLALGPSGASAIEFSGPGPWDLAPEWCGPCSIVVEAEGMVAVAGTLTLVAGENRVSMQAAGELQVTIRDELGAPVEGVELCLVAPRTADTASSESADSRFLGNALTRLVESESGWTNASPLLGFESGAMVSAEHLGTERLARRTTDVSGSATWTHVPPAAGYRWTAPKTPRVEPMPRHERERFDSVEGELVVHGAAAPEGVSGSFEIRAGKRLELAGVLPEGVVVRGRVASTDARARVVLYRVEEKTASKGQRGVSFEARHSQWTANDGAFEFRELHPGTWMLRAWWERGATDLHFAARAFRVGPGTELDLGTITALEGESLDVTVELRDTSGQVLDPRLIFPSNSKPLFAELSINVAPADDDANHMLSGLLPVPFDRSFRVHGLRPGRVLVAARPGTGLRADPLRVSRIDGAQPEPFETGSRSAITVPIVVHVGSSRALVLRTPEGERTSAHMVWAHELSTGKAWVVETRPAPEGEEGPRVLTLPDGTYELWCKLTVEGEGTHSYVGNTHVDFDAASTSPVEIQLVPAAAIFGVVRDREGRPAARRTLVWSAGGWPVTESASPLFSAQTDERGAFVLLEVPPRTKLWGAEPGTDLEPIVDGARRDVELTLRNGAP